MAEARQGPPVRKPRTGLSAVALAHQNAPKRARDLLQRDFAASAPNEKWVCDITYLRTWNGF
jgi:transposase InsO family protein